MQISFFKYILCLRLLDYWQLFIKIRKYDISKMSKFTSVDHASGENSFSILFCLPLNIYQTYKSLNISVCVSTCHTQADIIQAGGEL